MSAVHSQRMGRADGLPTLLAHCFLGHSASWARLLAALQTPVDALAFDLPGHGRSPMPADPGDFHAIVADAVGALSDRPRLMIGHSFGAASMLRHALHHPGDALGLVLIEPVAFCLAAAEPEYAPYRAQESALHQAVSSGDLAGAARQFLALNPGSPDFDRLPAPVQAGMAAQMRLVAATVAGLFGDSGGMAAPGVPEGFAPPVLIVLGEATTPIFHGVARALSRRLPRVEVATIPGAGHIAPVSHPVQTASAIDDWIIRNGLTNDKPRA